MPNRITFQLELMGHDAVMRESFQKIQDFLGSQNSSGITEIVRNEVTNITEVESATSIAITEVLCDVSVYKKSVVRFEGGKCVNAKADNFPNSRVAGICINKPLPDRADIVLFGRTTSIFTGLDQTKEYYLSPTVAGGITTAVPSVVGQVVQKIGRPLGANRMDVNIMSSMIV